MADTTRWAALGVVLVTAACGGSAAMAPTAASPAVDPVVADPAPSRNAEPPPSKELVEGIKAFDAGQYPEARSLFEAAVKKNKADYEALYNLGMASEKVGDKAAAEAAYQSALETKPDLDTASAELSALYIDEGRADVAITVARAGLAKHPGSAALHENLGIALAARDEADEATRELEAAIQIAPADPMLQLTLAHWLNVWHVRGAAPHLDAARARAKGDYGLIASVGHEYRMAGEFDSCVQTFDSAIAIRDGGEVRTERALCRLGNARRSAGGGRQGADVRSGALLLGRAAGDGRAIQGRRCGVREVPRTGAGRVARKAGARSSQGHARCHEQTARRRRQEEVTGRAP